MSISEVSLYKALRNKLGDETASELVEFVKSEVNTEMGRKTDTFLTKEDKLDLIEKMNKDKIDLIKWMVALWVSAIGLIIAIMKFT